MTVWQPASSTKLLCADRLPQKTDIINIMSFCTVSRPENTTEPVEVVMVLSTCICKVDIASAEHVCVRLTFKIDSNPKSNYSYMLPYVKWIAN